MLDKVGEKGERREKLIETVVFCWFLISVTTFDGSVKC